MYAQVLINCMCAYVIYSQVCCKDFWNVPHVRIYTYTCTCHWRGCSWWPKHKTHSTEWCSNIKSIHTSILQLFAHHHCVCITPQVISTHSTPASVRTHLNPTFMRSTASYLSDVSLCTHASAWECEGVTVWECDSVRVWRCESGCAKSTMKTWNGWW